MSGFKIKKLPKQETGAKGTSNSSGKIKKRLRIFVGGVLFLFFLIFGFGMAWESVGNIQIGTNEIVFKPIIFGGTGTRSIPEEQTNILIAGIGGQGHEGSNLTDSIMLARFDEKNHTITLLSIPRDLYVAYPGDKSAGRINSLYGMSVGDKKGINLLAEKVSEITGQPIHHYMILDFTGFKYVVNALGGIDIDVPKDVIDYEYPNDNWGYTTFSVKRGVQVFDGETALKYARSRHSTSDFDRSERQQLLIKAIKDKAISLDFLTSPSKIQEVLTAIRNHIDTDLTISHMIEYGSFLKDLGDTSINVYSLGNSCTGLACSAGSFLYTPAREYFNGASVLIPENASATKLSYYDDTARFSEFIFGYPWIRNELLPIKIIYSKGNYDKAKSVAVSLKKLGFQFQNENLFYESTGAINESKIVFYHNAEANLGWNDAHRVVEAFRFIEEKIPYVLSPKNEYITTEGPKIEIIIGKDIGSYFTYSKPAYYLPYIPTSSGETQIQTNKITPITSGEAKNTQAQLKKSSRSNEGTIQNQETEYSIAPGEWEDF